jgi:glycosyltransferase involved in cell wall biosynthesis
MKVLHISSESEWRGGEQQLAYLVDELNKNAIEQLILCTEASALHNYCTKNKLTHFTFSKGLLHQIRAAKQVKQICTENHIDILHAHDSHAHNFAILAADLFSNPTPIVLSRKVAFRINNNWFSNYKYNHKKIKKIICVSDAVKSIISSDIQDKSKLCTVYDCVDLNTFSGNRSGLLRKQYNVGENELIIGNIAALSPEKDHTTFINTAEILISKGVKARFIIIGTGDEKKINDKIIFHGFAADVSAALRDLDIFLFTSEKEGLGSILLAAFASKVPVIATAAGGIPELVKNNETGLLANVGDAQKLSENILLLINSPGLKEKMTSTAHLFVQQFSKEAMCKKMLEVYRSFSF